MAAAVTLAARGIPVTVFEAGPVLGGRARRVVSQGHELDNGQHILVGAYSELWRILRTVGVPQDAVLRLPLEIRYAKDFSFRALWFPAPFDLLGGLLAVKGVSLGERLGAVRFLAALRRAQFRFEPDISFLELLKQHRQDGPIGHYLWAPVCVAALNTPIEQASANVFLAVLRDTLAGPPGSSDLLLPRVDLSRLFPEPAAEFVKSHGGEIRLRTTIQNLSELKFDAIIVAVGPHQLKQLLPGHAPEYSYQPIYTCYLQYPERLEAFPVRRRLAGRRRHEPGNDDLVRDAVPLHALRPRLDERGADEAADQRVRGARRQAEPPREEIPGDRAEQGREHRLLGREAGVVSKRSDGPKNRGERI